MFGHDFPYLDTRDINLDWLLKNMKKLVQDWTEYQLSMNTQFSNLTQAFDALKAWVESYFENLDVSAEIEQKLDRMAVSGELGFIMRPIISGEVSDWLAEHITQPTVPAIDSSLTVAGAAADAKAAGDRIAALSNELSHVSPFPDISWTLGKNVDGVGNIVNNAYTAITPLIPCAGGDLILRTGRASDGTYLLLYYVSQYKDGVWKKRTELAAGGSVTIDSDANGIIIGFGRAGSSQQQIQASDISNYFGAEFFRKSVPYGEYQKDSFIIRGNVISLGYSSLGDCALPGAYFFRTSEAASISDLPDGWNTGGLVVTYTLDSVTWQIIYTTSKSCIRYGLTGAWADYFDNAFIMRGSISTLGYTSFSDCKMPGVYIFTTADLSNLSDVPDGLQAGGLLFVYTAGATAWQEIMSNPYSYLRYGYTGAWQDKTDFIFARYITGSGDDASTERIMIDIRKDKAGRYIRYAMGHCESSDRNADVWRLMYVYLVPSAKNDQTKITRSGEFECAVHLDQRDDFSGGYTHGDEIDDQVTFICDGVITSKANVTGLWKNIKIVRNSILYDPDDHTTAIAEHGVEYQYTKDGLTIRQSVKWLVSEDLTTCYLAMLPLLKTYAGKRFDDVSFDIVDNPESNWAVTVPGGTSASEIGGNVCSTMSIPKYPTGLTGGDSLLFTDNGGLPYNKIYFVVCTSGTSQIGEIWKSETVYRFE